MSSWNSCRSFSALYVVTFTRSSAYWDARLRYLLVFEVLCYNSDHVLLLMFLVPL